MLLNVPEQYPLMPPAVRYRTKIFHPNVHFKVCHYPTSCVRANWSSLPFTRRGVVADGRNLLRHPEDGVDARVDVASRLPGDCCADVRLGAGQPAELRRGQPAARR